MLYESGKPQWMSEQAPPSSMLEAQGTDT